MTDYSPLWSPIRIGSTELDNRVALAPMTRISATQDGLATERMASYYQGVRPRGLWAADH